MRLRRQAWVLVGTGIGLYLLFLIIQLPATLGWKLAPSSLKQQIQLSGIEGSIWNGSAEHLMVGNIPAGSFEWQLSPWSLLLGRLSTHVHLERGQESLDGRVTLQSANAFTASGLRLSLNGETLSGLTTPYLLHGRIRADIKSLSYEKARKIQADGHILLRDAHVEGPQSFVLGRIDAQAEPEDEGSLLKFSNQDSPLDVNGSIKLNGNGSYSMKLGILNRDSQRRDISNALKVLGKPDATGRVQLKYFGNLRFHQTARP